MTNPQLGADLHFGIATCARPQNLLTLRHKLLQAAQVTPNRTSYSKPYKLLQPHKLLQAVQVTPTAQVTPSSTSYTKPHKLLPRHNCYYIPTELLYTLPVTLHATSLHKTARGTPILHRLLYALTPRLLRRKFPNSSMACLNTIVIIVFLLLMDDRLYTIVTGCVYMQYQYLRMTFAIRLPAGSGHPLIAKEVVDVIELMIILASGVLLYVMLKPPVELEHIDQVQSPEVKTASAKG